MESRVVKLRPEMEQGSPVTLALSLAPMAKMNDEHAVASAGKAFVAIASDRRATWQCREQGIV